MFKYLLINCTNIKHPFIYVANLNNMCNTSHVNKLNLEIQLKNIDLTSNYLILGWVIIYQWLLNFMRKKCVGNSHELEMIKTNKKNIRYASSNHKLLDTLMTTCHSTGHFPSFCHLSRDDKVIITWCGLHFFCHFLPSSFFGKLWYC